MNIPSTFTSLIGDDLLLQTKNQIDKAHKIAITTHLSPDGDALGSSLALYHYLLDRGKDVRVIVPNAFPYFLKWMNGSDNIVINTYIPNVAEQIIKTQI